MGSTTISELPMSHPSYCLSVRRFHPRYCNNAYCARKRTKFRCGITEAAWRYSHHALGHFLFGRRLCLGVKRKHASREGRMLSPTPDKHILDGRERWRTALPGGSVACVALVCCSSVVVSSGSVVDSAVVRASATVVISEEPMLEVWVVREVKNVCMVAYMELLEPQYAVVESVDSIVAWEVFVSASAVRVDGDDSVVECSVDVCAVDGSAASGASDAEDPSVSGDCEDVEDVAVVSDTVVSWACVMGYTDV